MGKKWKKRSQRILEMCGTIYINEVAQYPDKENDGNIPIAPEGVIVWEEKARKTPVGIVKYIKRGEEHLLNNVIFRCNRTDCPKCQEDK